MDINGSKAEVPIMDRENAGATGDATSGDGPAGSAQAPPPDAHTSSPAHHSADACVDDFRKKLADPGPLGLIAFGMTTFLFNVSIADLCPLNTTTAGMVLCYGGSTQVLSGIMEFIRGNTFGCTITTTFGAFWLATACVWLLPRQTDQTPNEYLVQANSEFMGAFFLMWAVFTFVMCASALRQPLMICLTIFLAGLNFTLQCISFWSGSRIVKRVAGFEGMCCGAVAMYCGLALTVNDSYNSSIIPLLQHNRGRIIFQKKNK